MTISKEEFDRRVREYREALKAPLTDESWDRLAQAQEEARWSFALAMREAAEEEAAAANDAAGIHRTHPPVSSCTNRNGFRTPEPHRHYRERPHEFQKARGAAARVQHNFELSREHPQATATLSVNLTDNALYMEWKIEDPGWLGGWEIGFYRSEQDAEPAFVFPISPDNRYSSDNLQQTNINYLADNAQPINLGIDSVFLSLYRSST